MEETQQIKEGYDSIKNNLINISDDIYRREENNRNKLQSLNNNEDELEENSKTKMRWLSFYFIVEFIMLILLMDQNERRNDYKYYNEGFRNFLGVSMPQRWF